MTFSKEQQLLAEAKLVKRKPKIGKIPHSKLADNVKMKQRQPKNKHGKKNATETHNPNFFNLIRI